VGETVVQHRKFELPESLGFRTGNSSVHTSRTMMLNELSLLLEQTAPATKREDYITAIVDENALGKPTQTTRKRTAQRLLELYSLDVGVPLFRVLRHFWPADAAAQPMLAFLTAAARDSLLRETTPFIVAISQGVVVTPPQIAAHILERFPQRFKPTTAADTSQRLASSWMQAGFLVGKVKKKRSRPVVTPVVLTYALFLGYLCGLRGKLLFDSQWTRMVDRTNSEVNDIAIEASKQGWLNYKSVGSVVEVSFPGLLTAQEERASHVAD
jgi:hypothetical protein